jgi:hypothetical protein
MLSHELMYAANYFQKLSGSGTATLTEAVLEQWAELMRDFSAQAAAMEAQTVPNPARINPETAVNFDLSNVTSLDMARQRRRPSGGGTAA